MRALPLIGLLVVAGSAIWVLTDAADRDWLPGNSFTKAWTWALATLILWIVAFPLYLVERRHAPRIGAGVSPARKSAPAGRALPPPGWLPDPQGGERWWDGAEWTEHRR